MSAKQKYIIFSALAFTQTILGLILDILGFNGFGWISVAVGFLIFVPATIYYLDSLIYEIYGHNICSYIMDLGVRVERLENRVEQLEKLVIETMDKNKNIDRYTLQ